MVTGNSLINITTLSVVASYQPHAFITPIRVFDVWLFQVDFMTQQSIQPIGELKLLEQLVGEWIVGIS
jgi:hypothetical protein